MRFVRCTTLLVGAMLALTACGDDSPSGSEGSGGDKAEASSLEGDTAEQVLTKARNAAKEASSVRISGNFDQGGSSMKMDMLLSESGGAEGTVDLNGEKMSLRQVGNAIYVKSDSFATSVGAAKYKGKWLMGKTNDKRLEQFTDLTSMDSAFDDMLKPDGKLKRVAGKDVDGTPTVGLDDGADKESGILYIAAEGPAYPLLIEPKTGPGSFTFSDWDKPVKISAPSSAEVFDLSKVPAK